MLMQSTGPRVLTAAVLLLFISACCCQFPAVCNTPGNLANKTCCPNNCGGPTNGICQNVLQNVSDMWSTANSSIAEHLRNATNESEKGAADSRYEWPTVVFQNVCKCFDNYGGFNCLECDYGWTGSNCRERKTPVIRKSFGMLSTQEKKILIDAFLRLKNEKNIWAVIATEPRDYNTVSVTLQNVYTYDFYVFMHSYVARDNNNCKETVNGGHIVDFAHSGPAFPVWHRHYLMLLEKDFQRITGNYSFGLPYWQWEKNDTLNAPFDDRYLGTYSRDDNSKDRAVNVFGMLTSATWPTVCDAGYIHLRTHHMQRSCAEGWKLCNPVEDRIAARPLQRQYVDDTGVSPETYLPNVTEVKIAIAAPRYDAPDYVRKSPRESFRSRLEGWNIIRSDEIEICSGGPEVGDQQHMHNIVHDWVGGHMSFVPAAVNDPIFSLHHCNIDRIMESWMNRFVTLPTYEPTSGGHPGHNRDDYLVPFFPLVTAGNRYMRAEELGYMYDSLIERDIEDKDCTNYFETKLGLGVGGSVGIFVLITLGIVYYRYHKKGDMD